MNKAATSDFNRRVVECRLATKLIAKRKGKLPWREIKNLSKVQKAYGLTLPEMIAMVESTLHEKPYSKEEVAEELGITVEELETTLLTPNTRNVSELKLRQRALHVCEEALRVKEFHETCLESSRSGEEETLTTLGRLMSESHRSLDSLYECSHARLNELVDASKAYVYGARLTGAGWGGCIVALVKNENLLDYMDHLKKTYYKKYCFGDDIGKYLFSTSPKSGACVYV
ncbi:unnamed protein product [Acanthoscelides obtectus]|nr:unnamed protein product [Acanthoscelides obtectus]CAK1652675.1 N-acetylgalactosamine kinase [Acanthoscelides obtectus]